MKSIDAVRGKVRGSADTCVAHDRNAAAGLVGTSAASITATAAVRTIKCVVCSPLVAHLMGNIVDREGITYGI